MYVLSPRRRWDRYYVTERDIRHLASVLMTLGRDDSRPFHAHPPEVRMGEHQQGPTRAEYLAAYADSPMRMRVSDASSRTKVVRPSRYRGDPELRQTIHTLHCEIGS